MEASEGGANGEPAEAGLGDGAVDDTLLAEAVEETFGDFVAVWKGTLAILLVISPIALIKRYTVYFGSLVQLCKDTKAPLPALQYLGSRGKPTLRYTVQLPLLGQTPCRSTLVLLPGPH